MFRRRPGIRTLAAVLCAALAVGLAQAPAGAAPPESEVNAVGEPFTGTAPDGSVRGFVDAHSHLFSYEAFGGRMLCGRPFHPEGITKALADCPDHLPNGELALIENLLRHGSPLGTHDPVGWPTFEDWPAPDSLTHQQAYHKWVERAWRGGLRLMVNQLVANRQLCEIYPLKQNTCDEMEILRVQARRTLELQEYIDERSGGPGRGWFRVVRTPAEARQVITGGKLAVVLGVETSEPFGCRQTFGIPHCTRGQIDRRLDELHAMGVRSMFLCHKYDNALCGVRFDSGAQGVIVNLGNLLSTGRFWQARTCTGPEHDNPIEPGGVIPDFLAGLLPPPLYPPAPHCNVHGLTGLGEYALQGMMRRGMMIDIDHMSVKAADRTLDLLEAAGYPGVLSSHSWMEPAYQHRIYALGGMITSYGFGSERFTEEWRRTEHLRDEHGVPGYGYGLDANGLGALPPPRAGNAGNPVRYPFRSFDGGVTLDRQRTGQRVWDVNTDGVAHYGLVPDWIEDLRLVAGDPIVRDMAAGAESFLRTWQAAASR
ncbi:Coagulation factor 5/8 type domain-containing protein [Actinomadura craniellae]|uniref:Coagulation factor 5/8 type domain-containing protein n=1 Tax=Actinomadura craniellae TaxID=2231787 RepID=A0A365HAI4_9ACTN|nr:membrane dipeptidase [Actinomadura craniellae]RAY16105.1 Coagulation factor 5/8 type domain-containing protein [Actinomadura craniellae]